MKNVFKAMILAAPLLAPLPGHSDGYVMGAGRWPCSKVVEVIDGEHTGDYFQMAGWILGFWSRESLDQGDAFNNKLEEVGGAGIFQFTTEACRKVAPETLLYELTQQIIESSH
ncbi:MAG TPA: hypothetical protein ENK83_03265 [Aliiroseovarius sp.]|nr:hypothetical protein [Aliiroseovarius sp.]